MYDFQRKRTGYTECMTQTIKILGLLIVAGVLTIFAMTLYRVAPRLPGQVAMPVTNFETCAAAGNPVMESYPRQCLSAEGQLFVEEVDQMPDPNQGLGLQANGCAVAGCSGQLCVSADEAGNIVTTCEYRSEYACYREASCEPQADGKCGWTPTPQLTQCLANPPEIDGATELEVM